MAAYVYARESARIAQKTLFYMQAVDVPQNLLAARGTDTQQLDHALLQVRSLAKTRGACIVSSSHGRRQFVGELSRDNRGRKTDCPADPWGTHGCVAIAIEGVARP